MNETQVHVWRDLSEVPSGFGPSVVTIGNFDGVHRGHLAVLDHTVQAARAGGLRSVAITFAPHPLAVLQPERAPQPLSTPEHRLELLADTGLDAVLMLPFTPALAEWSPRRFVEEVMTGALGARAVVVGSDTRFGRRNAGDIGTLRELGAELGFTVDEVADLKAADESRRWSSTLARELIAAGDVRAATDVLGRPHRVTGVVVHGDHRGREMGFPTANLTTDSIGAVPSDGVYAGWLVRAGDDGEPGACSKHDTGERLPAAISVGTNPTFDGDERRVEAYVLGRTDLDLYGERVAVEFVEHLRPTLRFEGMESLIKQMNDDVARCREVLGVSTPA
ncbi:bifunctional riboflavin kinase/FAD synthetase [Kineosporia succinea]|uniref:Riboflavin biosynthesis protein n=1 Tax=Kineosporia succinea TaxID=84632 RepID=A0ABT9NW71_9ACTN|nr:bifunctional riboflavin kinase/FAD synthetase [Kineosporia succinea]MDP9824673.1 riboflavin kinase/FMN adenylyltransferase [Kineosporia succinea]